LTTSSHDPFATVLLSCSIRLTVSIHECQVGLRTGAKLDVMLLSDSVFSNCLFEYSTR